jgi:Fe-S-cluster containining protein
MNQTVFSPLIDLYKTMDAQWKTIADAYSFTCNGCKDNCCKSLFYHHTYIEQAFLLHGFNTLASNKKQTILDFAKVYCEKTFANGNNAQSLKMLCPINEKGRCLLYAFRPMICRLHGLPHELNRPGSELLHSPGCETGRFDAKPYVVFDRIPFYKQMTQIEMAFRLSHSKSGKLKMTVAQILLSQ